jgi:hypothetical protein
MFIIKSQNLLLLDLQIAERERAKSRERGTGRRAATSRELRPERERRPESGRGSDGWQAGEREWRPASGSEIERQEGLRERD